MSTSAFGVVHGEDLEKGLGEAAAAARTAGRDFRQGYRVGTGKVSMGGLRELPHNKLIASSTKKITPITRDPGHFVTGVGDNRQLVATRRKTRARELGERVGARTMPKPGSFRAEFRRQLQDRHNARMKPVWQRLEHLSRLPYGGN